MNQIVHQIKTNSSTSMLNVQKNYLPILINEYLNQVSTCKKSFEMVLTHILS